MSFLCDKCGSVYEWEMFYNNHMRSIHCAKVNTIPRSVLAPDIKKFLEYYFHHICANPTLGEIKELSDDLEVKKEKIYWWFVNYRKKSKKMYTKKNENVRRNNLPTKRVDVGKTISRDGATNKEGHDVGVPPATSKRGKGEKKGSRIRARDTKNNTRSSTAKKDESISDESRSIYSKHTGKLL